jgi:putative DNA-invertase from lambdoid prophage Rac
VPEGASFGPLGQSHFLGVSEGHIDAPKATEIGTGRLIRKGVVGIRHVSPRTPRAAAIYVRVSKADGTQSTENQLPEVEQLARARGFDVVHVYDEQASALKHRPKYASMLRDAKRGKFDVVIVWALDRLGRSMVGNLQDVLELDRIGVQVVSVRESWLDTGGPVRNLLIAVFSWVAEQERARLVERTRAGMEQARRRGSRIGRPQARLDKDELRRLRAQGLSVRKIAEHLGVGSSTVQRHLGGPS